MGFGEVEQRIDIRRLRHEPQSKANLHQRIVQGDGLLQSRQRPRSSSQLTTGMLSYQRMAASHFGQRERGWTTDLPCGRREMQTFRKLPKIRPRTKPMASYAISGVTSEVYGER